MPKKPVPQSTTKEQLLLVATRQSLDGWMRHQLNGPESEQTLGDSEGQGSLAFCSPWDLRVGDEELMLLNCGVGEDF